MGLSICVLSFLIRVRPMSTDLLNFVEIYNEFTYLFCLYMSYYFTDFAETYMHQYEFGFFYIYFILLNLAVNLLVLISIVTKDGYLFI